MMLVMSRLWDRCFRRFWQYLTHSLDITDRWFPAAIIHFSTEQAKGWLAKGELTGRFNKQVEMVLSKPTTQPLSQVQNSPRSRSKVHLSPLRASQCALAPNHALIIIIIGPIQFFPFQNYFHG